MRIHRKWVSVLANEVIKNLCKKNLAALKVPESEAVRMLDEIILNELSAEDRLNREVRNMLKKYELEIEKGRLDFRRLFELTKQKLVKERNIIL